MSESPQRRNGMCDFQPCESEVQALITKANAHALGSGFLKTGALESVAAMFETHAFTVDAARRKLNGDDATLPDVETMATGTGHEIKT